MDWGKSTVMDLINGVVENPPRGYQVWETDEEAKTAIQIRTSAWTNQHCLHFRNSYRNKFGFYHKWNCFFILTYAWQFRSTD